MEEAPSKRTISADATSVGATSRGAVTPLSLGGVTGFTAGFTRGALAARSLDPEVAGRALAEGVDAPDAEVVTLTQVHGRRILAFEAPARKRGYSVLGEGDAVLTCQPNVLLLVASADCVPVVLADPVTGWIAAVHAGWRGTAARVLDAVLDALAARGVEPQDLRAAFGPSISRDRYEVGPEVVAALREAYRDIDVPAEAVHGGREERFAVDVAAFNAATLRARGARADRTAATGLCTASTPDLPSWRRDGPGAGRILTGIARLTT
ncbi:MAG TPA: polyphenol oxidase family protein [Thermoanaerobaculia bacterium]|nr:polyphenol oxidase family protein [Thermoanaerobaculia bacterium]